MLNKERIIAKTFSETSHTIMSHTHIPGQKIHFIVVTLITSYLQKQEPDHYYRKEYSQ